MPDRFRVFDTVLDSPAKDAFAVTPANTDLSISTRSVYVGNTGNLVVMMESYDDANTIVTFSNVPSGTILPIRVKQVRTSTTATNIVGLY